MSAKCDRKYWGSSTTAELASVGHQHSAPNPLSRCDNWLRSRMKSPSLTQEPQQIPVDDQASWIQLAQATF